MIWPETKYIGCAQTECEDIHDTNITGSILVCYYYPL